MIAVIIVIIRNVARIWFGEKDVFKSKRHLQVYTIGVDVITYVEHAI